MIKILVTHIPKFGIFTNDPLLPDERAYLIAHSRGIIETSNDGAMNVYAEFDNEALATMYCLKFEKRDQTTGKRANQRNSSLISYISSAGPEIW